MEEKDEADQGDDDAFFNQLRGEILDRSFDQRRAIIDRDNLHPFRQACLECFDLPFDRVNHGQRIFS